MTLTQQVQKKIDDMIIYAEDAWDIDMDNVSVNYDLTSTRTLGSCRTLPQSGEIVSIISLNQDLLKEFKEDYITHIVGHEMCHSIMGHIFPRDMNGRKRVTAHGKEFKAICSHFGIDGKATSSVCSGSKHLKSKRKTIEYKCGCCTHNISTIKHNRILKGIRYSCKLCKNFLKIVK